MNIFFAIKNQKTKEV